MVDAEMEDVIEEMEGDVHMTLLDHASACSHGPVDAVKFEVDLPADLFILMAAGDGGGGFTLGCRPDPNPFYATWLEATCE